MRIRPYISSAVFVSALLAGSAWSLPAMAQKGQMLAPVTGWAITKVGDDAANPYCALARRFRQNTILTLAQNLAGETSLALDFQAPRLDPAQNMTIVLDPGAGQQRSYHVAPVSAKAFVVRLGQDVKFFDALQTTGHLRIDAGGETYNFNLSDIDAGHNRLGTCVASLTEPAAGDGGFGDDRVASMRQDIESLRQENRRLSSLAARASGDDVIVQEMSREMDVLQSANQNLRSKAAVSGVAAGAPMGGVISDAAMAGELDMLRAERVSLQAELQTAAQARRALEDVQFKMAALERENATLRAAAEGARRAGRSASPQSEIFVLKEENARLQKLLEQRAGTPVVVEALQARVFSLEQENARLAANAQQMSDMPLDLLAPAAGGEAAGPQPLEASAMQQKLDEMSAQLRERDAKLVQMSNLMMEIENLKTRNRELEKQLLERSSGNAAVTELNEKIKSLQDENNRLIAQLQQAPPASASSPEVAAQMAAENAELKKQIETLRQSAAEASDLRAELDKLRAENENLKTAKSSQTQPAENEEIATLRLENEDLKKKVAALSSENTSVKKENRSLKDRLAELMKSAKDSVKEAVGDTAAVSDAPAKKKGESAAPAAAPPLAMAENSAQAIPPVVETEVVETQDIIAKEGMTEAQRMEAQMRDNLRAKPPVAPPSVAPVPVKSEPAPSPEPVPVMSSGDGRAAKIFEPALAVQDIVANANVAEAADVKLVEGASTESRRAYQWRSGPVYGSAEQMPLAGGGDFQDNVDRYIEKTRKRCTGDFAAVADALRAAPGGQTLAYEIACVGKGVNSTASLLFIQKQGTFTVIANETSAENMDEAMDMRDRLQQAAGRS